MTAELLFRDRIDAGRRLGDALATHQLGEAVIYGLARGGVVVAHAAAERLRFPVRVLVVRKVGAPHNPELALGAVSETGERWLDPDVVRATGASQEYIRDQLVARVREAHRLKVRLTSEGIPQTSKAHTAIVVDDGIATGASALVALRSMRGSAGVLILATPVASRQARRLLEPEADQVVVLHTPEPFRSVGSHYEQFEQVTDTEVAAYLESANRRTSPGSSGSSR